MAASKKRVIKSLENLSEDLKELLRTQYPNGYEGSITRIINAKKEPIFVFPLEADDAIYLIKLPATKNSEGEYDVESVEKGEFGAAPEKNPAGAANDDDFDNSNEDDFDGDNNEESDDYDEEGGGKRNREASYDPDFDG
ncbi:MAG TPA: hypothetical protein VF473_08465 [Cyclobacteriaceae bacterium]